MANQYVTEVKLARTPTDSPTAGQAESQLATGPSGDIDLSGDEESEWVKPQATNVIRNAALPQSPILTDGLAAWTAQVRVGPDYCRATFDHHLRNYCRYFRRLHLQIHHFLLNAPV